jgi:hypothetical protein
MSCAGPKNAGSGSACAKGDARGGRRIIPLNLSQNDEARLKQWPRLVYKDRGPPIDPIGRRKTRKRGDRMQPALAAVTSRRIAGAVAPALWLASLTQTVTRSCAADGEIYSGYTVLLLGGLGPLEMQFGWFANPLMLWTAGCLLFGRRAGLITASLSLVLALSSFTWTKQAYDNGYVDLCGHGLGFHLWIACAVFLFAIAVVELIMALASRRDTKAA